MALRVILSVFGALAILGGVALFVDDGSKINPFLGLSGAPPGLLSSEIEIQQLERCSHSALEPLWADPNLALQGGDMYSGVFPVSDFRRIIALVPEWIPAWDEP